ncbi:hypothetical protein OG21DRAFT_1494714 [Imleria badia]|nr:hypothetical protein OG21DRAFT_1494714 [Imleria badia]
MHLLRLVHIPMDSNTPRRFIRTLIALNTSTSTLMRPHCLKRSPAALYAPPSIPTHTHTTSQHTHTTSNTPPSRRTQAYRFERLPVASNVPPPSQVHPRHFERAPYRLKNPSSTHGLPVLLPSFICTRFASNAPPSLSTHPHRPQHTPVTSNVPPPPIDSNAPPIASTALPTPWKRTKRLKYTPIVSTASLPMHPCHLGHITVASNTPNAEDKGLLQGIERGSKKDHREQEQVWEGGVIAAAKYLVEQHSSDK